MENDIYTDVTSQIRDVLKKDTEGYDLDDEKQKRITYILKNNFNKKDEQIGKTLMEDVGLFNTSTGYTICVSLFIVPIVIIKGFRPITPDTYPNYNIMNEYMGYTDNGVFYKAEKTSRIKMFLRSDMFAIVYIILAVMSLIVLSIL